MRSIFTLLLLLFATVPTMAATPKHTYVVGGCTSAAKDVVKLFAAQKASPQFDLYIICDSTSWHSLAMKNSFDEAITALTVPHSGMIWIGPKAINNPLQIRKIIEHELDHLRCDCDLGEQRFH